MDLGEWGIALITEDEYVRRTEDEKTNTSEDEKTNTSEDEKTNTSEDEKTRRREDEIWAKSLVDYSASSRFASVNVSR